MDLQTDLLRGPGGNKFMQIDYATPKPVQNRRRNVLIVSAIVLSLVLSYFRFLHPILLARRAAQQAAALAAAAKAQQLQRWQDYLKRLTASGEFVYPVNATVYSSFGLAIAPEPEAWEQIRDSIFYTGQEFSAGGYAVHNMRGTVFSHRRQAEDNPRFVHVGINEICTGAPVFLPLILPTNGLSTIGKSTPLGIAVEKTDRVQVLGGQVDPDDASRFTIICIVNDQKTIIDGTLTADDRLFLTPRAGVVDLKHVIPLWIPPGSTWVDAISGPQNGWRFDWRTHPSTEPATDTNTPSTQPAAP